MLTLLVTAISEFNPFLTSIALVTQQAGVLDGKLAPKDRD